MNRARRKINARVLLATFGCGVLAVLLCGCPLDQITGGEGATGGILDGVAVFIVYQVSATMQDSNGLTYETTHTATFESTALTYDAPTRTYTSADFGVRFSASVQNAALSAGGGTIPTSVEHLRGVKADESYWPVETTRTDHIEASGIPYLRRDPEYAYFEEYHVYRLNGSCSTILDLRYMRIQKTPSVEDPAVFDDFSTWLVGYSCDASSYIEVAIRDPEFGRR